jgi:hypothetical protein
MIRAVGDGISTLSSIARLVVLSEPSKILVLDPRHPSLVLVIVAALYPLGVGLLLLLLVGQAVVQLFLLILRGFCG